MMPNYNLIKSELISLSRSIDDMTPFEVAATFEAMKKIALGEASADERLGANIQTFEKPVFVNEDKTESMLYQDEKVTVFLIEHNYSKPEHLKMEPSLYVKIGSTVLDATKLDRAVKALLPFDLAPFIERFEIAEQKYHEMYPIMLEMGRQNSFGSTANSSVSPHHSQKTARKCLIGNEYILTAEQASKASIEHRSIDTYSPDYKQLYDGEDFYINKIFTVKKVIGERDGFPIVEFEEDCGKIAHSLKYFSYSEPLLVPNGRIHGDDEAPESIQSLKP